MLENISIIHHSSIKFSDNIKIYFDPYEINENNNDADIIFITHNHYDHYSENDIKKIYNANTKFIITKDLEKELLNLGIKKENIITVVPCNNYNVLDISFMTIPAYNINKPFHPKENNWVGYLINYNNFTYYIAGDTDITKDNKLIKCDVAFLPIGGKYTMNYKEAAELTNIIKPKIVVPIHYGLIVGTTEDAIEFSKLINKDITCKILIK